MPTVAGVFKDTVITTGACKADTAYGTITVQNQTISLSSNNSKQTVCINTTITDIVHTLGGTATGVSVVWSPVAPAGVTGNLTDSIYVISGIPTVSGTFIATISTTGTCSPVATIKDTIIVNPDASITLSSASGTDNQTVCNNSAITDITYAISGSATGATISWLPSAPSGSFSGVYDNVAHKFTISGTPTTSGTFDYTITVNGSCGSNDISGTITVQSSSITLASGIPSQTACLGSSLTNIVFTTGGGVTGASITWTPTTPADINGTYLNGSFTISSGTLTQLGTFNYTITTTGGCSTGCFSKR